MNYQTGLVVPLTYYLACALVAGLSVEAAVWRRATWGPLALVGYATVAVWYLAEIWLLPDPYAAFSPSVFDSAYGQVCLFLVAYRVVLPGLTASLSRNSGLRHVLPPYSVQVGQLGRPILTLWAGIILYGIARMQGDVLLALAPIEGRSELGSMWARAGVGGATDFLVSTAGYVHLLVCAAIGLLVFLARDRRSRFIFLSVYLISLPYFLFVGARNQLLAVILPCAIGYWIVSRHSKALKLALLAGVGYGLESWMRLIVNYRNVGFKGVTDSIDDYVGAVDGQKHFGVNMGEELMHINTFYGRGDFSVRWGMGYIDELLNVIPRALYPNKPLIGYDYAILRGFGVSGTSGVSATVSTGLIGQGFIDFGPFAGPIAAAVILAVWTAFLYRLWGQRTSIPRLILFLAGTGMTLNLGRDFSLIVLWPIVFGYLLVRLYESRQQERTRPQYGASSPALAYSS